MLQALAALLQALNALSPLGIIALLGVVILLMVHKDGPIQKIANNHLDHAQGTLEDILENGKGQLEVLNDIKADINYVKGKLDR